jgi:hypothetical protein
MKPNPDLTHSLVAEFSRGRLTPGQAERIAALRRDDPAADLLFRVVEALVSASRSTFSKTSTADPEPWPMRAIDGLVADALSGRADSASASRCLETLSLSPVFFGRFYAKLAASTADASTPVDANLSCAGVTEEEWLKQARKASGMESREAAPKRKAVPPLRSWRLPRFGRLEWGIPAAMAAAAVLLWIVPGSPLRKVPFEYVVLNKTVPCHYYESETRGSVAVDRAPELERWVGYFKMGIADYIVGRYTEVETRFRNGESGAMALRNMPEALPWIDDYYFFWGQSLLGEAAGRRRGSAAEREAIVEAVRVFGLARGYASAGTGENGDRDGFYLGLAMGLLGRRTEARTVLETIPDSDPFSGDARALLNHWSTKEK